MAKIQQSSGQFTVDLSSIESRNTMFFDRFSVFKNEDFSEVHFGFFGHARDLQKGLIVVLSQQTLTEQRDSLMQYLNLVGMPEAEPLPGCDLRGRDADLIVADVVGMARHGGELAEITFHLFSWKVVVETMRSGQDAQVRALCVAILRCTLELQKRLILELFDEDQDK